MAELGYYVVPNVSDKNLGQRYILVNDIYVQHTELLKTRNKSKKFSSTRPEVVQYFKGTLLREVDILRGDWGAMDRNKIFCLHAESDTYFQCHKKDVKPINEDVFELLLAISNCRDRYDISQNQCRLAEGLEMTSGTDVLVRLPNSVGEIHGVVRYKGPMFEKEGTHFGVELYDADGRGNTNGTIGKRRYFQCDADSGVFLSLNRVTPLRYRTKSPVAAPRRSKQSRMTGQGTSGRSSRSSPETCPNTLNISREELSGLGITHGAEVYIFTEVRGQESQEKGKVKFIGRLPGNDSGQGIYVGIDLDKPVGNGTGLYNGKHLFYTRQNHAALVPLSGVLPAYTISNVQAPPPKNHVYEDMESIATPLEESTTRRSHREGRASPRHQYHTEELPVYPPKTFVQPTKAYHSSPSVLRGERSNRFENTGKEIEKNHRSSPHKNSLSRNSHSPMDLRYGEKKEDIDNHKNSIRAESHYQKQKTGSSRHSRRINHFERENSSEDELADLYGSDHSVATKKAAERAMDWYDDDMERSTSPTMSNLYRPRTINSMPVGIATTSSTILPPRSTVTAPGDLLRTRNKNEAPFAEMVDYNSISNEINNTLRDQAEMEVGTMVEVTEGMPEKADNGPFYGVIRWTGWLPEHEEKAAGVELEREISSGTDGTFNGIRYFDCETGRGLFIYLKFCRKDPRFATSDHESASGQAMRPSSSRDFGNFSSPQVCGDIAPPRRLTDEMAGKMRGIQGHHNSCYLDSTLFSLFAFSYVLDTILFRKRKPDDLPEYEETQKVLKEFIINPLRKHNFVRADRIMQLRELLDKLGSVSGLVSEEKDPEEFLNTLLVQVFKADPLMELRQGDSNAAHEGYFYQIFTEKDEKMGIPSTQQLLEKSLISADLKFRNVPVCLILQMPRFGKDYKMYKKLRPSLQLDITNLVEEMPRSCDICERVAEYECRDCFLEGSLNEPVFSYCKDCAERVHSHRKRTSHCFRAVKLPDEFREYVDEATRNNEHIRVERQTLELFAVVCIATSHYVSFAKCGTGTDASWCFFDSMADRVGEQSGYNIPEITKCPDVEKWLTLDEQVIQSEDEKLMPELKRRLLCDAYMCMYQSRDLMFNK